MDDFWLMVAQQNSDTIVMLCNCLEMHKEKSAKYWPEQVGDKDKDKAKDKDKNKDKNKDKDKAAETRCRGFQAALTRSF